jgi:subtilisin family serine protease
VLALLPPVTEAAPAESKFGPLLAREIERGLPPQGVRVVVQLRGHDLPVAGTVRSARIRGQQDAVLRRLARRAYKMRRRHRSLPGFVIQVGRRVIRRLVRDPEVEHIYLDGTFQAQLTESQPLIGAVETAQAGFTGAGVNVAVLDTGIDTDHPWLMDNVVAEYCWCSSGGSCCAGGGSEESGPGSAEDDNGHGTAVSGIITSASSRSR